MRHFPYIRGRFAGIILGPATSGEMIEDDILSIDPAMEPLYGR